MKLAQPESGFSVLCSSDGTGHLQVSWLIVGPYLQRMLAITGFVGQHVPFSIDRHTQGETAAM